jgi:hypothetical protein
MNPIALVEVTTATRSAVLGALATDRVVPSPKSRFRRPNGFQRCIAGPTVVPARP